ncbi:hypothetical protein [Streptomyces sp. ODS05-4]|uniref:hypothetical protein n=1 Tax=Streptomyces sp. ODS05-4 TaxID=2944939 RepID=UPI00210E2227|nr:hypothetical protein [Streptomyces sp. ODS05-4]
MSTTPTPGSLTRPRAAPAPGTSRADAPYGRPGTAPAALAPAPAAGGPIDCLVTHHPHLPRDRMGRVLHRSGRSLILAALAGVHGRRLTPRHLTRDDHQRWHVPALGLHASVSHCGTLSAVALCPDTPVGVDLQDERDRPGALTWLGGLLGRDEPATIGDFAACEALIKVSHLTKETFTGVRIPAPAPGWRPTGVDPYLVCSLILGDGTHLALAAGAALPVRWWRRPRPGARAARTHPPTQERA